MERVQFANPPIVICSELVALKGIKLHLSGMGSIDEELTDNVDNIFQIKAKDFSK